MKTLIKRICPKLVFAITLGVCFCLFTTGLEAQDNVQVKAAFSKRQVLIGEEFQLKISIEGEFGNMPRPRLPQFEGFEWYYMQQSSRVEYSSQSKKYNKIVEFIFVFVPQKAGTFNIGPFEIPVEKKIYQHPAIEITVSDQVHPAAAAPSVPVQVPPAASTASSGAQQSHPFQSSTSQAGYAARGSDRDLFLKAWTDKKLVYPGEQVTMTYSLFTRLDTRYEGFQEEPNTKGFWMEELSMKQGVQQQTVNVNGLRFLQADVRKIALFGTQPGEYVIKPGSLKCSVRKQEAETQSDYFGSFFEDQFFGSQIVTKREDRVLGAEDLMIVVRPFPDKNKPAEFDKMVGSFVISAVIDKEKVKVNEPVKVDVSIQGKGNIDTIVPPLYPQTNDFRVIDGASETKKVSGDVLIGWKKYSYLFVPKATGEFTIGPFRAVFFDPYNEKYMAESSTAFKVTVIQGDYEEEDMSSYLSTPLAQDSKKSVEKIDTGVYFINESLASRSTAQNIEKAEQGLKVADAVLFLLFIVAALMRSYQRNLDKNIGLKRSKGAYKGYLYGSKKLDKRTRSKKTGKLAEVYSEIARITMNYFSDKFNLANLSLTYQQIEEKLEESSVSPEMRAQVRGLFEKCDYARFAPSSISQADCKETLNQSRSIVTQFEKMKVMSHNET
jgi:hypothetical protein